MLDPTAPRSAIDARSRTFDNRWRFWEPQIYAHIQHFPNSSPTERRIDGYHLIHTVRLSCLVARGLSLHEIRRNALDDPIVTHFHQRLSDYLQSKEKLCHLRPVN
jgi:hypothetical protein